MQNQTQNEASLEQRERPSLYEQHAMKESIKSFTNSQYVQLFKIVQRYSAQYTQNSNGVFFNLKDIPTDGLIEMKQYINYIEKTNIELKKKR